MHQRLALGTISYNKLHLRASSLYGSGEARATRTNYTHSAQIWTSQNDHLENN